MVSKKMLISLALLLGVVLASVPALATSWSLAGDFSSTAQGNNGWSYVNEWGQSLGSSATSWGGGGFDYSYGLWTNAPVIMWGSYPGGLFLTTQATGWGKYPMSWGQVGTFAAGVVGFITGSNNGQSTAARWVASVEGDYSYSVTFSAPAGSGDLNGVYVNSSLGRLSGTEQYLSTTNTSYSYTGTQHLLAGQYFEFVQDTQNSSNVNTQWDNYELPVTLVDATITDTPAPEPGSMMVLATGLVGLVGFGIRRRKG